jgi:phosphatidylinositol alpha-1,6-mannosyltransferase
MGLFPELLGTGGIQEAGRQTVGALSTIADERGWQLEILSLNDASGEHHLQSTHRSIRFLGFGRRKISLLSHATWQALSPARETLCLVLAGHPNLAPAAHWIKGFSRSVRTIVVTHGVEVWSRLSALRRVALLQTDLVLAPSQVTAGKLTEVQRIRENKIRRLAWSVNPDLLRMSDEPSSLQLPFGFPRSRVVLTVGRWSKSERYKGLDDLIRATAELRGRFANLHLVVVGGGDDLPRLRRLAVDAQVGDAVDFLDRVSDSELAACYANADVFALPSTGEGFGLVFLEAMAFARPIVAAACGGAMDIVVDGVNGLLIPPHNPSSLVRALSRLLEDDSLRRTLGRQGSEMVRRKYQFGNFKAELEHILSEVVPLDISNTGL